MKLSRFSIIALGLAITACTNESESDLLSVNKEVHDFTFTGIQREIVIDILTAKYGGFDINKVSTRSLNEFTLKPYINDGDTLMYIVQYSDGWEVYSAKKSSEMILFSSDNGIFNLDDPEMPEALRSLIEETGKNVRQLYKTYPDSINPSWGSSAITKVQIDNGKINIDWDIINKNKGKTNSLNNDGGSLGPGDNNGDDEEGHWVLIGTEDIKSTPKYTSEKLVKTKWGQAYPWNSYTPLIGNQHTLVGCGAVALGQYEYYTHYKDGFPKYTVDTATEDPNSNGYLFSGWSATIWDLMGKTNLNDDIKYAPILLGYIAKQISTNFGLDVSVSNFYDLLDLLNSTYNGIFYSTQYDFDKVKKSLDNYYPIVTFGKEVPVGHFFLIDQYRQNSTTTRYTYGWEGPYGSDRVDTNVRDEEGNIIGWGVTSSVDQVRETFQLSMNWGWDGKYDEVFYNPDEKWNNYTGELILLRTDIE